MSEYGHIKAFLHMLMLYSEQRNLHIFFPQLAGENKIFPQSERGKIFNYLKTKQCIIYKICYNIYREKEKFKGICEE